MAVGQTAQSLLDRAFEGLRGMRLVRLLIAVSLTLALSACASPTPRQLLIGTWVETITASDGGRPAPARMTVDFRDDGTFAGTERIAGMNSPLSFTGTWKLASDGSTVDIARDPDTGTGVQAVLKDGRLTSGPASDPTVLTKHKWWMLW